MKYIPEIFRHPKINQATSSWRACLFVFLALGMLCWASLAIQGKAEVRAASDGQDNGKPTLEGTPIQASASSDEKRLAIDSPDAPDGGVALADWNYDQIWPAIDYSGYTNDFMVAWEDHVYASGEDWDIIAHRIGLNGQLIGGNINVTSASVKRQMAPDLANNATNHETLVVYESETESSNHEIYASRLDYDGNLLASLISINSSTYWDSNPVVAYDSVRNEYLVVWERRIGDLEFNQYDIYAQRVGPDGSPLGSVIPVSSDTTNQRYPALAYNPAYDEYLVVWQEAYSTSDWDIMGQRIAGNGGMIGGKLTIEAPGHSQTHPAIVYNTSAAEYLVVWEDQIGGETTDWDIKSWRLSGNGANLAWYMIASFGAQRRMNPSLTYLPAVNEYIVAYDYEYSGSDTDVFYSQMRGDGTLQQVDVALASSTVIENHPAISASTNGGQFLITWEDWRNYETTAIDLYAQINQVLIFTGHTWDGAVGERSQPLSGAIVGLYCSNNSGNIGSLVESVQSDAGGAYWLAAKGNCEYYNLQESTPDGYQSAGAQSTSGGSSINSDWIQFVGQPPSNPSGGNEFWDYRLTTSTATTTVTMTPSRTPTTTPTQTSTPTRTSTSTATRTPTVTSSSTSTQTPTETSTRTPTSSATGTPTATQTSTLTGTPTSTTASTGTPTNTVTKTSTVTVTTTRTSTSTQTPTSKPTETATTTPTVTQTIIPGPDLTVTDLWQQGTQVCFQIWNKGDSKAIADFLITLFIDGNNTYTRGMPVALNPDQRWTGCFNYSYTCSPPTDQVAVSADVTDMVDEGDETNNTLQKSWSCDTTAPTITSGPTVSDITNDSAVISWQTDEASNSALFYSTFSATKGMEVEEANYVLDHSVTLNGLTSATIYYFYVESRDQSNNLVRSADLFFTTLAYDDIIDPSLGINPIGTVRDSVTVTATVTDNQGVSWVGYFVDGVRRFTDYSPPYRFTLDTTLLDNGDHQLDVQAVDVAGRTSTSSLPFGVDNLKDSTYPVVTITQPLDGDTVAGKLQLKATITDDTGIISARFYVGLDSATPAYTAYEPFDVNNPPKSANVTFEWDTRALENNSVYRLYVQAFDNFGKETVKHVEVTVYNAPPTPEPDPPYLEVTNHTVMRDKNRFIVFLTVKNTGDLEAKNVKILDGMVGFQGIEMTTGSAVYTSEHVPVGKYNYMEIRPSASIAADDSRLYAFNAMPVLTYPSAGKPQIGNFVDMYWDSPTNSGLHHFQVMSVAKTLLDNQLISDAHASAIQEADYLIVTDPYRMFIVHNPTYNQGASTARANVNSLLSSMAQLAYYRQGALGYIYDYTAQSLLNLLKQGGQWNQAMGSTFNDDGYLLLVGETDVIPGWYKHFFTKETASQGTVSFDVPYSDYPYANTYGDELHPELSMGRIVGNDPVTMRKTIDTAIHLIKGDSGYHYDGDYKFFASGFPTCLSGGCANIDFQKERNLVINQFSTNVSSMAFPDYTVNNPDGSVDTSATTSAILSAYFNYVQDQDIIFQAAHGSPNGWDLVSNSEVGAKADPYQDANPFVFTSGCSTGMYKGNVSVAETELAKGAAAALNAVQFGMCGYWCPNSDTFFANWDTSKSFARALRDTKESLDTDDDFNKWWIAIYQLFGDAKFGAVGGGASATPASKTTLSGPSGIVEVSVPDPVIEHLDESDVVIIPEGEEHIEPDEPLIPVYLVRYTYPAGTQVQDVRLVSRSEPTSYPNLQMSVAPLNVPELPLSETAVSSDNASLSPEGKWMPGQAFKWYVYENASSTNLVITLYPFTYNPLIQEGLFYKNYTLEITTQASEVVLTSIQPEKSLYALGETVQVELGIENQGKEPLDVLARAFVERAANSELVDGLLLKHLEGLEGKASFAVTWDTTHFPADDYAIRLEILDMSGNLLDQQEEVFQVGISQASTDGYSVTPLTLDPGEAVSAAFDLHNTGEIALSGTFYTKIQNSQGQEIALLSQDFTGLIPGASMHINMTWDSSGTLADSYTLVSYVEYQGRTTEPLSAEIQVGRKIFLPFVRK